MSETNETPPQCFCLLLFRIIKQFLFLISYFDFYPSPSPLLPLRSRNATNSTVDRRAILPHDIQESLQSSPAGSASATEVTFLDPYLLHPTHTSPIFVLRRSSTSRCFWLVLPPSGPCILQVCPVKSEFPFLSCSYVRSDYLPPNVIVYCKSMTLVLVVVSFFVHRLHLRAVDTSMSVLPILLCFDRRRGLQLGSQRCWAASLSPHPLLSIGFLVRGFCLFGVDTYTVSVYISPPLKKNWFLQHQRSIVRARRHGSGQVQSLIERMDAGARGSQARKSRSPEKRIINLLWNYWGNLQPSKSEFLSSSSEAMPAFSAETVTRALEYLLFSLLKGFSRKK
jgi:hypothetical protein